MHSDFMSAVGAYMSLTSIGATRYAAGVQIGGTTLRATSLRVDVGSDLAPSAADKLNIAADRIGIGRNSRLINSLAPFLSRLDMGVFDSGRATSSLIDGRFRASADAVTVGSSARRTLFDTPAESAIPMFRAYARGGWAGANDHYEKTGPSFEARDIAAVTVAIAGYHSIDTGAGSDSITALDSGFIDAGDGNNTLNLTRTSHVTTGAGNDRIAGVQTGHIDAGEGNNTISATQAGHIHVGAGDDTIVAIDTGHIHAGEGRNFIDATGVGNIRAGAGNDTINATGANIVQAGDGDNVVTVARAIMIETGAGNDRISASSVSRVDAGDGDNIVAAADVERVNTGRGRDTLAVAGSTTINTGAGDDTIDATDVKVVIGGGGDDRLTLARATAIYRRGEGRDTVRAGDEVEINFHRIGADEVNVNVVRDDMGRATAIEVALKDGSGGVSIVAGPNGSGDATIRFADGTSVPYALVADGLR